MTATVPQYNQIPQPTQPMARQGGTTTPWYRFFAQLLQGLPPQGESAVPPTGSPFSYPVKQRGFLVVQGGSVSMIQVTRGTGTNVNTGVTAGCIPASANDIITINYSSAPVLTFFPQ